MKKSLMLITCFLLLASTAFANHGRHESHHNASSVAVGFGAGFVTGAVISRSSPTITYVQPYFQPVYVIPSTYVPQGHYEIVYQQVWVNDPPITYVDNTPTGPVYRIVPQGHYETRAIRVWVNY